LFEIALGPHERELIRLRTLAGLAARFVEGDPLCAWPSFRRLGFRRISGTGRVEVEPREWSVVESLFDRFTRSDDQSLDDCARWLNELGVRVTRAQVRTILRDPIYVTGEWQLNWQGRLVARGPVRIPNPIPPEVFDRAQSRLA
jgi:hypothetical protein